jgi:leucyl-tRNA synthetase
VERYGADTARCYILSLGPPDQDADWSDSGVSGVHRFLSRVWRLDVPDVDAQTLPPPGELGADALRLARKAHETIARVTRDIERFHFNTALAALNELVNDVYRLQDGLRGDEPGRRTLAFAAATTASLLFPFAPHLGAEVYERVTGTRVWEEPWPDADPGYLKRDMVKLVVQVNGKVRDSIEVAVETDEDEVKRIALERPNVRRHLDGRQVVREVVVPGRLVNFVLE